MAKKPASSAKAAKATRAPKASAPAAAPKPAVVKVTAAKGRPMLTWVGKRPLAHVQAFPAQLVERFAADSGARSAGASAPAAPNLLFHGDNKDVLAWLLANGYRGKVQLVYIDPPFDSGADYVRKVGLRGPKGSMKVDGETYTLGEQVQYTDIWANDNYLQFMYERLLLLKELLAETGSLFLHCDERQGHRLRCILDEVFGTEAFRNELIWYYSNKYGANSETFDVFHNSIYWYSKGKARLQEEIRVPVKEKRLQPVRRWNKELAKNEWLKDESGNYLYQESSDKELGDVWEIPVINPMATDRTDYPTQKPPKLLDHVIRAASRGADLVLDCFIGSGTTAAVAQKLGRRWIGCDINKGAIQTTMKRLQGVIEEQAEAAGPKAQGKLLDVAEPVVHGPLAIDVYRVNDYDLQIQHNEAVALACEFLGVQRTRSDRYFDGTRGKQLVKIVPFNHPLSPADLTVLQQELIGRPTEDRDILFVCLGMELAAGRAADEWNTHRKGRAGVNRIEVVELRSDPKYGGFFQHQPATAKVSVTRKKDTITVAIADFISPSVVERLKQQAGVLQPRIDDWRAMVDTVMIDTAYDGRVFNVVLSDVPERKTDFVEGRYEFPAPKDKTTVAVKVTDMLGEEVLVTATV